MRVLRVNELAAEATQLADAAGSAAGPAFAELAGLLAHFVRKSLDNPPPYQREDGAGASAVEAQLQDDLWSYLNYTALSKRTGAYEPQKVGGGGRADIALSILDEKMVIECKRELANASRDDLQKAYAGQAGAYSAAEHPFGAVAILDLMKPQSGSPPMFYDCLWLHQQSASDGGRTLLFMLIPGRRKTPSRL
jgi:hypothetical protein